MGTMATKEDSDIEARLRDLKKDLDQNEERMRKAATDYQDLLAKRETLTSAINELKAARRRHTTQTPV